MLRYTVGCTFSDEATAAAWIEWLQGGHIADVMAGGATSAEIVRLDALNYEVVYRFASAEAFAAYERDHAPRLRAEGATLFPPDRVVYRRGVGTIVDTF